MDECSIISFYFSFLKIGEMKMNEMGCLAMCSGGCERQRMVRVSFGLELICRCVMCDGEGGFNVCWIGWADRR